MNIEEQKHQIITKINKYLNQQTYDSIKAKHNITTEQYYKQFLDFLPQDFIELIKNNENNENNDNI